MYDSEQTDLVVKYYDLAFGISGPAELAWYLSRARASGGPVLDLACGTGRLAILIAQENLPVVALDQSAGMLNQFRAKLDALPPEVRARIRLEHQTMSAFDLGTQFDTVICCDAFFHNLTVADQIDCLTNVARHLTPTGRFLFNLPNPTCDFILRAVASGGRDFHERGRYPLPDNSGTLLVEQAHAADPAEQRITTTLRLTRFDPAGWPVEHGESTWTSRYLYRYEAVHLLHRCGFHVAALVGDYHDGPVTNAGQLVFDARLLPPLPGDTPHEPAQGSPG